MGSLRDELAADYGAAVDDYDQSFTWHGETYPCVRQTGAAALTLVKGGEEIMASDRITVALVAFGPEGVPQYGDLVDGNRLQIVKIDPNIGHLVLWCSPPMNTHGGAGGVEF